MRGMEERSPRRLTRSRDRRLGGVCGGLADYFGLDPTLVRVAFVLFTLVSVGAGGLALYLLLWMIMPGPDDEIVALGAGTTRRRGSRAALILGMAVLFFAVVLLSRLPILWWPRWDFLRISWPATVLLLVVVLVIAARGRR